MTKTRKILLELGLDDTLAGFQIIENTIGLIVEDPTMERGIQERAYIVAAERAGLTCDPSAASRNITYLIRKAAVNKDLPATFDRVERKWGVTGLTDALNDSGISPKKLILKLAHFFGREWDEEV